MNIDEWKVQNPAGAAQYDKPLNWFKHNVKCCYNCPSWFKDPMLMGDYGYNCCIQHNEHMTKWDCFCDDWCGVAEGKEDNLLDYTKLEWTDDDI